MRRLVLSLVLIATALACAGCVDRRLIITSEPSGAAVFLNDAEMGRTPMEVNFTYFGVYDVRVRKDGYEPLITQAKAKAPFYEWPVIDFFALLVPVTKKTRIEWHFELEAADVDEAGLLERALETKGEFEGEGEEGPES